MTSELDYRFKHYNHFGWALQKKKTKEKTGEEYWVDYKYPGNLLQTAKALLEHEIPQEEFASAKELIEIIKQTETRIFEKLTEIVGLSK